MAHEFRDFSLHSLAPLFLGEKDHHGGNIGRSKAAHLMVARIRGRGWGERASARARAREQASKSGLAREKERTAKAWPQ